MGVILGVELCARKAMPSKADALQDAPSIAMYTP
jgi:hypothetical protein